MKKIILFNLYISFVPILIAQVSINVTDAKSAFHIDALDNNASGVVNSADDDVVFTSEGRLGLGLLNPLSQLHIKSSLGKGFILKDGNEAENKVLTTNADGVATWVDPGEVNSATAVFSANGTDLFLPKSQGNVTPRNTGTSLTLSPGKWIVQAVLYVGLTPIIASDEKVWLTSTWSESPTSTTTSPDTNGKLISSLMYRNSSVNILRGAMLIHNSSSAAKTYWYIVGPFSWNFGTTDVTVQKFAATPSVGGRENIIYAIQVE